MLIGIVKVLCVLAVLGAVLAGGYVTYTQMQRDRWNTYMKWFVVGCVVTIIIAVGIYAVI